jgi:hypothetical protein
MVTKYSSETADIQVDTKRDPYAGGNSIPAERAVIGLNESAIRKVIRVQQADTPVKVPPMEFHELFKWEQNPSTIPA